MAGAASAPTTHAGALQCHAEAAAETFPDALGCQRAPRRALARSSAFSGSS